MFVANAINANVSIAIVASAKNANADNPALTISPFSAKMAGEGGFFMREFNRFYLECLQKITSGPNEPANPNYPRSDIVLHLFDTLHTEEQLSKEVNIHAGRAAKYLAFHDTYTCWHRDVTGPNPEATGIGKPITELIQNDWRVCYQSRWSNGLMVLERKSPFRP